MTQVFESQPIPTTSKRTCGDCAMCCKLPDVPELNKKGGEWCPNCVNYKGCGIYDTRPQTCRTFFCVYVMDELVREEWNPMKSKMVLAFRTGLQKMQISVMVDPSRPDAWRKDPYITDLRSWARGFYVIICIAERRIAVLPDHEKDFGIVQDGDLIDFIDEETPNGPRPTAVLRRGGAIVH